MAAGSSNVNVTEVTERLAEEDEGGLEAKEIESEELPAIDTRFCLVGRLLSGRVTNFNVFQNMMASLWQPVKGLFVKKLSANLYLFQFYHQIDLQRVIDGSPWSFDRKQLIIERLQSGCNPRDLKLNHLDMWVQIHDLRAGFMSRRIVEAVGNHIREFLGSDPNNFIGVWRDYFRVRVRVPVNQPLKRRMKIKPSDTPFFWVNFKYERVPTFCFVCGIMGHSEKFCEKTFDTPLHLLPKPYGLEMKASRRKPLSTTIGARWLRTEPVYRSSADEFGKQEENPAEVIILNAASTSHDPREAVIPTDSIADNQLQIMESERGEGTGFACEYSG